MALFLPCKRNIMPNLSLLLLFGVRLFLTSSAQIIPPFSRNSNGLPKSNGGVGSNPYIPFIRSGPGPVPPPEETNNSGLSDPQLAACFSRVQNCLMVFAAPFERRVDMTPDTCAQLCVSTASAVDAKYRCKSFIMDKIMKLCDIYALTGNQPPARLWPFANFDYYQFSPSCVGSFSVEGMEFTVDVTVTGVSIPITTVITTPSTTVTTTTATTTITTTTATTATTTTTAAPTTTTAGTPKRFCEPGTAPVLQQVDGYELQGSDGFVVPEIGEQECVDLCVSNMASDGSQYLCRTIDYFLNEGACVLSTEAAVPTRSGVLIPNPDAFHIEKMCVDENLSFQCPGVMYRFPQKVLIGFNTDAVVADTFEDCVQICLGDVECLSALYYYDRRGTQNCFINYEDHESQPVAFVDEDSEAVEYFSVAQCNRAAATTRFFAKRTKTDDIREIKKKTKLNKSTHLRISTSKHYPTPIKTPRSVTFNERRVGGSKAIRIHTNDSFTQEKGSYRTTLLRKLGLYISK